MVVLYFVASGLLLHPVGPLVLSLHLPLTTHYTVYLSSYLHLVIGICLLHVLVYHN